MKTLILLLTHILLLSCNEQAYYQKDDLKGLGVPDQKVELLDVEVPQSFTSDTNKFPVLNESVDGKVEPVASSDLLGSTEVTTSQPIIAVDEDGAETVLESSTPNATLPESTTLGESVHVTPEVIVPEVLLTDASDSFVQPANESSKIDILWVIDNSGSMKNEQDALAANFDSFISEFLTKNIDFNMAVTTTDSKPAKEGRMIYGLDKKLNTEWAQSHTEQFIRTFKHVVSVGTKGSGKESGLNAVKAFMNLYQDRFIRTDAKLAVVVLSDEEDQSPLPVESYVNLFPQGKMKFYTIISKDLPLLAPESIGYRYMEAARQTNGVIASIRDNFNSIMGDFGEIIVRELRSFTLSGNAVAGTVRVFVDGVERLSGWNYNEALKSINFDDASVPTSGSNIRIEYKVNS